MLIALCSSGSMICPNQGRTDMNCSPVASSTAKKSSSRPSSSLPPSHYIALPVFLSTLMRPPSAAKSGSSANLPGAEAVDDPQPIVLESFFLFERKLIINLQRQIPFIVHQICKSSNIIRYKIILVQLTLAKGKCIYTAFSRP